MFKMLFTPVMQTAGLLAGMHARRLLHRFRQSLPNCRQQQNEFLLNLLRANQDSDFGSQHRFAQIKTYDEFTQAVPLSRYEYFLPYIDRCKKGEPGALFGSSQKLVMFALTSGTTGNAKTIPVTQSFLDLYRRGWNIWGIQALTDHPKAYLRKILQISSPADESMTEAGIPCGAISGMLAKTQKSIVRRFYACPYCVSTIANSTARYYTSMRVGIAQDVAFLSTANPSTTLTLAQIAEKYAESILRAIHDGTLNPELEIAAEIRKSLKPFLRKNPHRAALLEKRTREKGRFLPQYYWNLSFLANWTGGPLSYYLPRLREYYGQIPIRDIGLLASEGRFSIPLEDNTPAGILDIGAGFYEFIPQEELDAAENTESDPTIHTDVTVLQACQLEKGCSYYLLVSNYAGLYRYHIGDIVRVTDHVGTTPVIEFLSRGAHISSLTGEKLSEHQVVEAVHICASEMSLRMDNFAVIPQWDDPPRYRLYVEAAEPLPRGQLQGLAERIDRRLTVSNMEYDSKRESERLACMEVRQVPVGFLSKIHKKWQEEHPGRQEQFKQRFLYNTPIDFE